VKRFANRELRRALAHAEAGGQALHDILAVQMPKHPPFIRAAHLFDRNLDRLVETARCLGIRKPRIHHFGLSSQHVDLWARPLERALKDACP
jgi:hypothetical protein